MTEQLDLHAIQQRLDDAAPGPWHTEYWTEAVLDGNNQAVIRPVLTGFPALGDEGAEIAIDDKGWTMTDNATRTKRNISDMTPAELRAYAEVVLDRLEPERTPYESFNRFEVIHAEELAESLQLLSIACKDAAGMRTRNAFLRAENARLFDLLTRAFERIQAEDAASANGDESALAAEMRAALEGDA